VFKVLNVPSLTAPDPIGAGAIGGVHDQPVISEGGPAYAFPFVWYELAAERMTGGLGAGLWQYEIDIRIHVFSQSRGMNEGQRIIQEAIRLMRQAKTPGVTGWSSWYWPHDATITLPFELLNGVAVRELVAESRLYVEETAA